MTAENRNKIRYKVNLKPHLEELNCFTTKTMHESDLLSLDETKKLLDQGQSLRNLNARKFSINFDEIRSERFKKYLLKLQEANPSRVYLWIERTNDCGTSVLNGLLDIKWDFDFSCSDNGVLTLVTLDFQDRILFDFFEEDGARYLDIEVKGHHWSTIDW